MVRSLFGAVFERACFSTEQCARILELGQGDWRDARVTDGAGGPTTTGDKRAQVRTLALDAERQWIFARLATFLAERASYGFALREIQSPLKIQRYAVGDHHGWHVDLAAAGCEERKLGISVQLSPPDDYDGGELQIYDPHTPASAPRDQGCAIAFPSYVPHTVTPVTRGVRLALTAWAIGPRFR